MTVQDISPHANVNMSDDVNMFGDFRGENGFTLYPNHDSPNSIDKSLVVVTYICVLVAVATLLAALGVRGKDKWCCAIRASYSVAVGSIILACLMSHSWKEGSAKVVSSPYVYRADLDFHGTVGLKIGLHSANTTLEGSYRDYNGNSHYVEYTESLQWADYGDERESYHPALHRGLPEPILRVMDFLTINDGGMRWGASFHAAGQITCALLWTAFAFWVLTNILLFSVVVYGAYMFLFTGFAMLMACVTFHAKQNDYPFYMIYEDDILELSYGWSFWLTLVTGAITTALGAVLILMDHFLPDTVADFFHLEKAVTEETVEDCGPLHRPAIFLASSRIPLQSSAPSHLNDRRGSIFLEPERRRSSMNESLFKRPAVISSGNDSTSFINKSFEGDSGTKLNPLFVDDKIVDYSEEQLKLAEMEKVCDRGPLHMKDHKASLATLKELRDNHANERKFTDLNNIAKSNEDRSRSKSLQSSTSDSEISDGMRPRSGSDRAAKTRSTQRKSSNSDIVIDVDSLSSKTISEADENIFFKDLKGMFILSDPETETKENGLPNQVEVEVETHHSSPSDLSPSDLPDLTPPPSFTACNSDHDETPSFGSSVNEYDLEVEAVKLDSSKGIIYSPNRDSAQDISIQIERC